MTMAPPQCACEGPIAALFPDKSCPVHGTRETRLELEQLRSRLAQVEAERDRYRIALEKIESNEFVTKPYGPYVTAMSEFEIARAALSPSTPEGEAP
jgi:hypothetical protein